MSLGQRLVSGTTQLTVSNGIARLVTVFTMPILTSLLSPEAYGDAALIGSIISLVSVFSLAGLDVTYARTYHSTQQPNGAVVEGFCWQSAIFSALSVSLLVWAGSQLMGWPAAAQNPLVTILLALGIFLSPLNSLAQTRARLNSRYSALAVSLISVGLVGPAASIAIGVYWRQDAIALLVPMVLGYLVPLLLLGMPSPSVLVGSSRIRRSEGAALMRIGLAAIVTAPMYWVMTTADRWFLESLQGPEAVGIYSMGYSVAILGMMVNNAIMAVWLPEASREYERNPKAAMTKLGRLLSRLLAGMALVWLSVAAAGGDVLRWLANERFHQATVIIPYVAGGVFFYGVCQLAMVGLVLEKKLHSAAAWWLIAGLGSVLLNGQLVPRLGGLGAAVTQTLSFALLALLTLISSQRSYRMHLPWLRLGAIATLILMFGAFMIPSWHGVALISLASKFPLGVSATLLTMWIIAPDWISRFWRKRLGTCRNGRTRPTTTLIR